MNMCEECKKLVGASRSQKPHKDLVQIDYKKVSSIIGSADEVSYTCKKCGRKWTHEKGTYGTGWF